MTVKPRRRISDNSLGASDMSLGPRPSAGFGGAWGYLATSAPIRRSKKGIQPSANRRRTFRGSASPGTPSRNAKNKDSSSVSLAALAAAQRASLVGEWRRSAARLWPPPLGIEIGRAAGGGRG